MKRVAYFGTHGEGIAGHYFKAIAGNFTQNEIEEVERLDSDSLYSIFNDEIKFAFFKYGAYLGVAAPVSPDDKRCGSKTVVLVENAAEPKEILAIIAAFPFLKSQFNRISKIYGIQIPQLQYNEAGNR